MRSRGARLAALVLAGACLGPSTARADEGAAKPRYFRVMEQELATMGLGATCVTLSASRARCDYRARSSPTERGFQARALYSDETDTIYFYVERYLVAAPHAASTQALLRRLMELNWSLLTAKFEWNPHDGEVRLSAVLNTDSNFDRRAFRSIVLALDTSAARYHAELEALIQGVAAQAPR